MKMQKGLINAYRFKKGKKLFAQRGARKKARLLRRCAPRKDNSIK